MTKQTLKILLIEVHPEDIAQISSFLKSPEYELNIKSSLKEALVELSGSTYDLVLLNAFLPETEKWGGLRQIRKKYDDLPVIVLNQTDDEKDITKALSLGAQEVLIKDSFQSSHLRRSIVYALERGRLLQKTKKLSEKRFREIIDKSADGMLCVDEKGIVCFLNPAVEKIFERKAHDIVGKQFDFNSLVQQDHVSCEAALNELSLKYIALLAKTEKTTEIEITFNDDYVKVVEMRATEMMWEGKTAYLVVFHDITTLVRLQRLRAEVFERERLAKMKDEFISTVSHELRTPLAIVKCAVENMRDGVAGMLSDKQGRIVKIASTNIDRLTHLIDDILDLSRLESGSIKVNWGVVSLNHLVEETVKRFQLYAQEKNITLEQEVIGELFDIYADGDKVVQVLDNLLSNALRYTNSKVQISLQVLTQMIQNYNYSGDHLDEFQSFLQSFHDGVVVIVEDDGDGIAADKVDELFSKFVQINRPKGGSGYKGTGLGLAICREIIELHQGRIWVESQEGQGSKFIFILPKGLEAQLNSEKYQAKSLTS